jgi:hypothetical protein
LLVLVVDDFEEKHPAELGDALGIAIDAGVLAHDVLDGFDGVANGHGLSDLLVEGGLEFVDGALEARAVAEFLDELDRCAHRRTAESARLADREIEHALSWHICSSASSTARAWGRIW